MWDQAQAQDRKAEGIRKVLRVHRLHNLDPDLKVNLTKTKDTDIKMYIVN